MKARVAQLVFSGQLPKTRLSLIFLMISTEQFITYYIGFHGRGFEKYLVIMRKRLNIVRIFTALEKRVHIPLDPPEDQRFIP